MLIGELGRRTGVPAHQLRYYETQGLLEAERGVNGYREYTDDAVVTVKQIRSLLDAGLSTQDIRYLLPCATGTAPDLEPCSELLATLRTRLDRLDQHIDALTRSRQALRYYLHAAEQSAPPRYQRCDSRTLGSAPARR